jgi:RNA polymerase primary sigma factor
MRQLKIEATPTERSPIINRYFRDINSLPMLTPEQEVSICKKIAENNENLVEYAGTKMKPKDVLVISNLRFVISVAKKYKWSGISLEDLINEGNLGLINAAERFDYTRGFKFISFAIWWIRQSIHSYIYENFNAIHIPLNKQGFKNRMKQVEEKMMQELGREVGMEEIVEEMLKIEDLAPKNVNIVKAAREIFLAPQSKKNTVIESNGEEINLIDLIEEPENRPDLIIENEDRSEEIRILTNCLSTRDKLIVFMYYGIGFKEMNFEEIGKHFDLSGERVRQILRKAILRIKYRNLRGKHLLNIK